MVREKINQEKKYCTESTTLTLALTFSPLSCYLCDACFWCSSPSVTESPGGLSTLYIAECPRNWMHNTISSMTLFAGCNSVVQNLFSIISVIPQFTSTRVNPINQWSSFNSLQARIHSTCCVASNLLRQKKKLTKLPAID